MFLLATNNNILPCSYLNGRRARQYIIISHPNRDDGAYVFYVFMFLVFFMFWRTRTPIIIAGIIIVFDAPIAVQRSTGLNCRGGNQEEQSKKDISVPTPISHTDLNLWVSSINTLPGDLLFPSPMIISLNFFHYLCIWRKTQSACSSD